jgi:hypothetical protein
VGALVLATSATPGGSGALSTAPPTSTACSTAHQACPAAGTAGSSCKAVGSCDAFSHVSSQARSLQPGRVAADRASAVSPASTAVLSALVRQPRLKASRLQVAPAEAAALSQGWLQAAWLCWHGFRDAGAEASYRSFRASWLWRWDLVARGYHLVMGLAFVAKLADPATREGLLWGWNGLPGEGGERGQGDTAC